MFISKKIISLFLHLNFKPSSLVRKDALMETAKAITQKTENNPQNILPSRPPKIFSAPPSIIPSIQK